MAEPAARIGLFGGTFDPVHYGHLRPAIELAEHFELDVLYLLPNHRPAHRGPTGASSAQRIEMLREAVVDVQRLEVDTREADRNKPTYTIETLDELRREQPNAILLFFLGMDAFARFDRWHRWQAILERTHLVVIDRPGATLSASASNILERQRARVGSTIGPGAGDGSVGVIERVSVTQLDISASAIRRAVSQGRSLRFLLPDSTREYIERHDLYRSTHGATRNESAARQAPDTGG